MPLSAALNLTAHLNAGRHSTLSPEVAARAITGDHAAHHVIDREGLLGLDPLNATDVEQAVSAAWLLLDSDWLLAIPRSGRLAPLTGPIELTAAALDAGAAVVAESGGVAWVPHAIGPAIQWQLVRANRPQPVTDPAESDRHLRQAILAAERTLTGSLAAPIERQETEPTPVLPAAYGQRAQQTVTRAWSLLHAVETALAEPPAALHAHGEQERHTALRTLRDAVDAALASAVTWPGDRGR